MKALILFLVLVSPLAFSAPAKEAKYLTLGKIKAVTGAPGATVQAVLEVKVNTGFHIQANPASGPNLIATTLEIHPQPGVEVAQPVYPEGKPYKLQGSPLEITALEGVFEIKIPLTFTAAAKPGKRTLSGTFRYQACDDKICFFPTKIPVSVPVQVTGNGR